MSTTQLILSAVTYGTPAGNYDGSSQDWFSDAVKAADYYRGRGGVQSIGFNVTGVTGRVFIDATLDSDPNSASWFDTLTYGSATVPLTEYTVESLLGNFTWIRARVEGFDSGVINSVTITY